MTRSPQRTDPADQPASDADRLRGALKKSASAFKADGVPFALAGSCDPVGARRAGAHPRRGPGGGPPTTLSPQPFSCWPSGWESSTRAPPRSVPTHPAARRKRNWRFPR